MRERLARPYGTRPGTPAKPLAYAVRTNLYCKRPFRLAGAPMQSSFPRFALPLFVGALAVAGADPCAAQEAMAAPGTVPVAGL